MSELGDIIAAYRKAEQEQIRTVLATVVKVEGSSYRMPGARMLVSEYGEMTGAISGGCLEGDALRRALLALHQQSNKLVTYDTTHESDQHIGIQLGCNGIVHILFEYMIQQIPITPSHYWRNYLTNEYQRSLRLSFHLTGMLNNREPAASSLKRRRSATHISVSLAQT